MKIDARMRGPAWIALLAMAAAAVWVSFTDPDGDKLVQAVGPRSRLEPARPADQAPRRDTVERVRFERLNDRSSAAVDVADLFAARSWRKPESAAAAPELPSAPPLPFTYLGRLHAAGSDTAFVAMGERNLVVRPGDLIQDTYRVERVAGSAVTFRHLPTGAEQTLVIGGSP
jgi:hypothetical protein